MSVQRIIKSIEQLLTIHTSLMKIAEQKTEIVKAGSIRDLQPLLMKERHQIQALEQAEKSRERAVQHWATEQSVPLKELTISIILQRITEDDERDQLMEVTTKLTNLITAIKQQEALNRSLIEQSLRFVDMSLDLLHPSINQFNYGVKSRIHKGKQQSVFDSKA